MQLFTVANLRYIKSVDNTKLPFSVIDHRWRQNVIRTKLWRLKPANFCTNLRQCGIYFLLRQRKPKGINGDVIDTSILQYIIGKNQSKFVSDLAYHIITIRFYVAMGLFSNRSQMTLNMVRAKKWHTRCRYYCTEP